MIDLNFSFVLGRLVNDPKYYAGSTGTSMARFKVASNRFYNDEPQTEYEHVIVYGRQADSARDRLQKGCLVAVIGERRSRVWQDDQNTSHHISEIYAWKVKDQGKPKSAEDENSSDIKPPAPEEDNFVIDVRDKAT